MCSPPTPWATPVEPTVVPRVTMAPAAVVIADRYETDTFRPGSISIVTDFIPATEPAKVTTPVAGADTG